MSLAPGHGKKRVCFIPTATGDSPAAIEAVTEVFGGRGDVDFSVLTLFTQPSVPDIQMHLMAQDVLLVGGGSAANLMAVWRAHGLAHVMQECWEAGVVLPGWSAGSLCWHRGGPTDSFGDSLAVFTDDVGLLHYGNGVHDSLDDQPRRHVYREYVANGELPAGYATEDGVGLHYIGTELHEAVAMRDGAQAWWVEPSSCGGYHDEPDPSTRALTAWRKDPRSTRAHLARKWHGVAAKARERHPLSMKTPSDQRGCGVR